MLRPCFVILPPLVIDGGICSRERVHRVLPLQRNSQQAICLALVIPLPYLLRLPLAPLLSLRFEQFEEQHDAVCWHLEAPTADAILCAALVTQTGYLEPVLLFGPVLGSAALKRHRRCDQDRRASTSVDARTCVSRSLETTSIFDSTVYAVSDSVLLHITLPNLLSVTVHCATSLGYLVALFTYAHIASKPSNSGTSRLQIDLLVQS